ncbi:Atypical kinase ADCK3, mitochondrial [Smittium mucronatum]|nr:Atypical kinase ADCK3, mitochondrial [Smittium mucronatum]
MPIKQLDKVMSSQFGKDWRVGFKTFNEVPFAAASIGQVHLATLNDDLSKKYGVSDIAVKVQYPGVSESIDSDLSNIQTLLVMSKLLPKGLYLDNTIKVARKELGMECDYIREAVSTEKFKEFFRNSEEFKVPSVIKELSKEKVLTTELLRGYPISDAYRLDQETRDKLGARILKLCLDELFVFRFMQTDPNWTNFLYDYESDKVGLIDFGASLGFEKKFLDLYMKVLLTAVSGDREMCAHWSKELGFLTGFESEAMKQAHVDSVMSLGEPFRYSGLYHFGTQNVTSTVKSNIPTIINERLTPPPDATYSLHRKLSGAFLLCSKLSARVNCKDMFEKISSNYQYS